MFPRLICTLITRHGFTSNPEIANKYGISLPTAISYTKELTDRGVIIADGKMLSTGGKKATKLTFNPDHIISLGIDIKKESYVFCAIDFCNNIVHMESINEVFEFKEKYFSKLIAEFKCFKNKVIDLKSNISINRGLGISIPAGIINPPMEAQSHALKLDFVDLGEFLKIDEHDLFLINDSNAGAIAETSTYSNAASFIYLSLAKTVGSGIVVLGRLMEGLNNRTGEVGHLTLVPNGRLCYCGKEGCVDPYLNESALLSGIDKNIEEFFINLNTNPSLNRLESYNRYIKYLAILINNLNNALDVKIILGGTIGPHLYDRLDILQNEIMRIASYPIDNIFLKPTIFEQPAAFGAAFAARKKHIKNL
ncbi:N-acetylmannosamine kinase [Anaerobiospirillum thomasii]|uniref:ROK family transcriptional regulator n=1 Tax=Anaerobiospirillum thomasii TaxID=179995 RepID=UPI000D9630D4|nr:ROK family transcriptional regulator [Anaerobiospirillum thomasii]SPT67561.1 N-acetylmannosamine kinase [Anaerobiospirillum thomasii]